VVHPDLIHQPEVAQDAVILGLQVDRILLQDQEIHIVVIGVEAYQLGLRMAIHNIMINIQALGSLRIAVLLRKN
jgi:hypothetical protein|tara:strand:+ start:471 stop:692 length:222 start_codon:yes stop_codon:yes gene_type:complete